MNIDEARESLVKKFGSHEAFVGYQVLQFSTSGQPCDVTFFKKKPALDVTFDPQIGLAIMYGAGAEKLQELLSAIRLSNGDVVSIDDIWVINPMPKGGISENELAAVDLAMGDNKAGPKGETVREIIRTIYRCETPEEEERFLRRYLAS
jgi:hypothetical protein